MEEVPVRNRTAIALALTLLMAACGGDTVFSPSTTRIADVSPTTIETTMIDTTTTTFSSLVAGAVADWGRQHVGSVCLQVTQSYPQVPDYEYDMAALLGELLTPVGVAVLTPGDACDAVLDVQMSLEGRPAEYAEVGTIYSGMFRRFDMTLSASGNETLSYHHLTDTPPGEMAASSGPATPKKFLEHWADVWVTITLEGLVQFWGPAAAIEALRNEAYNVDAYSTLCEFAEFPPGECLPSEYETWRMWFDERIGGDAAAGSTDPIAEAAGGPHRYLVTRENLGVCEGAADDGEETIELVFGPGGLTFTNLTYEWTHEYRQVATNEYYRLDTDQDGAEWHEYVTLTADGLVLYSETTDPESGGQAGSPAPCYRYTYTHLD
jgi:hypothetical protein